MSRSNYATIDYEMFNRLYSALYGRVPETFFKNIRTYVWRKCGRVVVFVGAMRFEEPADEFPSEHMLAQLLLVAK
jgi:hypothetical protein